MIKQIILKCRSDGSKTTPHSQPISALPELLAYEGVVINPHSTAVDAHKTRIPMLAKSGAQENISKNQTILIVGRNLRRFPIERRSRGIIARIRPDNVPVNLHRSEEHTSELQSPC